MKKLLFLALGIALELNAQTDVKGDAYTGRLCVGSNFSAKYTYAIPKEDAGHDILDQWMGWSEPIATETGEVEYYRIKMKSPFGAEEYKELSWLYRQDGSKVYFYDEEKKKDILLMDFGLEEGDTFCREYNDFTVQAEVIAVYDTILSETYNAESYKGKAIKLQGKAPYTWFQDIWVEGIGSIYTGLYPTWKAYPSDVFLLTYDRLGYEINDYAGMVRFFPDRPGQLKTTTMTRIYQASDEYKQYRETYGDKSTYEFRGDTLFARWIMGINCADDAYIACLIHDGPQNKRISFAHPESMVQTTCYSTYLVEVKLCGFEPGEYIVGDTTLICQGADIPEVCDFEPVLKEGRTWNYIGHDTYTMTDDYYSLQVGGDTVVSDIPCKKILYIQGEKVRLHSLMYEKDGRVYGRSDALGAKDGEWLLYFDFNMKEGETFEWYGETYRVVEKDTLNTYGHKRRRIHFCKEGWEYNKGVFTWIEGIGGKEGGLDMPFMLPFNRYTIYLQSCYDGRDIIYSPKGNEMVNAYRPFVEEGKVWKMGWYKEGVDPTTTAPVRIECQYLQGDTIIDGLQYKRLMISEDENMPARYAGAVREDQRVVLFCPIGSTVPLRLYDFASPAGTGGRYINFFLLIDVLFEVNLGEIFVIDTETYKGCGREVRFSGQQKVTWLQGVGHMGLYSLDTSIMNGGSFRLLSCTMGDEVLYYDSSLMPQESEAKKKKLDFTHVIKAQPRAPRHRARQEGDGTLKGEYSDSEMFVRLNPLMGDYTATLADASGRVVYQKTVLTDNVLALNTTLTAYGPGNYVLTLENDDEAYTATLNIEPNGIEKVQGSKGSSTSEAAKPSAKGSKVQGIYDLQGRQLQKAPEKGVYIEDGKKRVIK